ncbi:MAG: MBL fold metallo-hydrolase [Patescibacteria group bacterium]
MILTYHGGQFIKAQSGDTIVAINPISKASKLKTSKFGADIGLISMASSDFNGVDEISFGEKKPFVAMGPGEYEVKNVFIKGFESEGVDGKERKINTIYSIFFDGMNLCFLGALSNEEIGDEATESLTDIDILFVPVGGDTLAPAKAYKLAVKLEPKLIIPLGDEADIKLFVKEGSAGAPEKLDKLTLKRKDLDGKEGEIVILNS